MAEEEILGDETAQEDQEGEEEDEDGAVAGILDSTGDLMSSFIVKILLGAIGLVAVVLMIIGVTYWTTNTFLMGTQPNRGGQVSQEQPGGMQEDPFQTYDLENDFILTKEDPRTGRTRTIKIHIVLAFNEDNAAVKSELENRKAQIRDLIYGSLGSMSVENLSYDNKQKIQDRLVSEINKVLTEGGRIQDVYFSDYVFQ